MKLIGLILATAVVTVAMDSEARGQPARVGGRGACLQNGSGPNGWNVQQRRGAGWRQCAPARNRGPRWAGQQRRRPSGWQPGQGQCVPRGSGRPGRPGPGAGFTRPGNRAQPQWDCPANAIAGQTTRVVEVPAKYLDRLQQTLEKELYARDFYVAAAGNSGTLPFDNLSSAEQNHADRIADAIRFLGGTPVKPQTAELPDYISWNLASEHCQEIEIEVIEVYKELIRDCPDPILVPLLERIQAANYRHLAAVGV